MFFGSPMLYQPDTVIPDIFSLWHRATQRRVVISPFGGRIYIARIAPTSTLVIHVNSNPHWYNIQLVYDPRNEYVPTWTTRSPASERQAVSRRYL